jgi:hypothetical protein
MAQFRKRPIIIEAIKWIGGDHSILDDFCGRNWGRADVILDNGWPSDIHDVEQVVVYNIKEKVWLPVPIGWWLIRGVSSELYPCADDVFQSTYESMEDAHGSPAA